MVKQKQEQTRPKGRIIFKDDGPADMTAIIIAFDRAVMDYEWGTVHRDLQKEYKANFPYFHRNKMESTVEKHCFSFLGFKQVSQFKEEKES